MKHLIVLWGLAAGAAAWWTGLNGPPGHFLFTQMTGFLPPHYGYSAYAVVPLLFLGPRWVRWAGLATILASGNRASWVGALAGWAWEGGARRRALAAALAVAAVVGGNALKPRGATGDSVRVQIWKAAIRQSIKAPGEFCLGVDGYAVTKAHSDVLQLAAERGWKVAVLALLLWAWWLYRVVPSPESAAAVALLTQSLIDNRLHHPACAALVVAVVLCASFAPSPRRT